MSVRNGPGEGTWSAFAEKMMQERDEAQANVVRLRAALKALENACADAGDDERVEWANPARIEARIALVETEPKS